MQPGDIVRLKSGGPRMTIANVDRDSCRCVWFDENHCGPYSHWFWRSTLDSVRQKELSEKPAQRDVWNELIDRGIIKS